MHITGANQSIQLSLHWPQRGRVRWGSNHCAVIRAGIPRRFLQCKLDSYSIYCHISHTHTHADRYPHTQACLPRTEWQLSSSSQCSWKGLWSGVLAEKCNLNHLHISAGLKSFVKVSTCGCHMRCRLHERVLFAYICVLQWRWPVKHAFDEFIDGGCDGIALLSQRGLISTTAPSSTLRRWSTSSSAPCPAGERHFSLYLMKLRVRTMFPFRFIPITSDCDGLLLVAAFIRQSKSLWANVAMSQWIKCPHKNARTKNIAP